MTDSVSQYYIPDCDISLLISPVGAESIVKMGKLFLTLWLYYLVDKANFLVAELLHCSLNFSLCEKTSPE